MSEHLMGIGAVPPTPPAGFVTLYPKLDGRVYSKDSTGSESALTAPNTTDNLSEGILNKYFTDERAQDAVGAMLADTGTIEFTYDDAGNEITADIVPNSITDDEINVAAAIALSKLASMTGNKAVVSDGAGKLIPSTTGATEIGYVAGVTSPIQAQLDSKQNAGVAISSLSGDVVANGPGAAVATIQPGAVDNAKIAALAGIALSKLAALAADKALISDGSGFVAASAVTSAEVGHLSGVTGNVQTQLNGKQAIGNYLTALTGEVTASGPGSSAATITDGAVTNAKIPSGANIELSKLQNVPTFVEAYGFPQVGDTLIQMLQKLAWSSMLQNDLISVDMTIPSGHTLLRSKTQITGLTTVTIAAGATLKVI
jgi:hypothetical protein